MYLIVKKGRYAFLLDFRLPCNLRVENMELNPHSSESIFKYLLTNIKVLISISNESYLLMQQSKLSNNPLTALTIITYDT